MPSANHPETFNIREVCEVLDLAYSGRSRLRQQAAGQSREPRAASRHDPAICRARHLDHVDFQGFEKQIKPSKRPKLAKALLNAAFGDVMTEDEYQERRAAFAQGRSPGAFAARVHETRRDELLQDPFSANQLWWSRSPTKQFFMLLREDGEIMCGLADKDVPDSGQIPIPLLQSMRVRATLNVTQWLGMVDKKIAEVIADRNMEPA